MLKVNYFTWIFKLLFAKMSILLDNCYFLPEVHKIYYM